jgi:hypothetical protein
MAQKKLNKGRSAKSAAMAIHASDPAGKLHGVGIWDLRVFIVPDGKFWFAQGLEIDLAAQGNSIEEAKANFEVGLESSIDLHLRMYENIQGLLKLAPSSVWQEALQNRSRINIYSQVSLHDLGAHSAMALPFDNITYLVAKAAAS